MSIHNLVLIVDDLWLQGGNILGNHHPEGTIQIWWQTVVKQVYPVW